MGVTTLSGSTGGTGDVNWSDEVVQQLGLESAMRPLGRPRKAAGASPSSSRLDYRVIREPYCSARFVELACDLFVQRLPVTKSLCMCEGGHDDGVGDKIMAS